MKTISVFRNAEGKESISLKFRIVGEAWFESCLFLIISLDISELKYADKFTKVCQENDYYDIFGKINYNGENCLIVKPKQTLKNMVSAPQELLSEREMQIVELVARGKSNKQIAKKLKISEWTVATHLRRVFTKLKVDSRAEMVFNCASLIRHRITVATQNNNCFNLK